MHLAQALWNRESIRSIELAKKFPLILFIDPKDAAKPCSPTFFSD